MLSRREVLRRIGGGFGGLGVFSVFRDAGFIAVAAPATASNPLAPRAPHFKAKAKRVIFLFMNGGPSHVDSFDPKPALQKYAGTKPEALTKNYQRTVGNLFPSPFKFAKYGQAGIDVSELFPNIA